MLPRAITFVVGVAGAAVPEKLIDVGARSTLVGYENPEDLDPEEWYVDAVRYASLLLAVAALIAPFLPTPGSGGETADDGVEDGPVVDVIASSDE